MVHEKAPPSSRPKGGGWEKEDAKWITLDWREKGGWLMVGAVVPTPLKEEREEGKRAGAKTVTGHLLVHWGRFHKTIAVFCAKMEISKRSIQAYLLFFSNGERMNQTVL